MIEKLADDANVLDWIMAWGVVIIVPLLGVLVLVEGFKWFHTFINRYFD